MNKSPAALGRNAVFFAQGGLFALLLARIFGLYIPNSVFLALGALFGLLGVIHLILAARSGEIGARRGFFMFTGISAAGITLGAILHNVFAALGAGLIGVLFFGLAVFVLPVLFVGSWCGSLVLLGTAGKTISRRRKRAAFAVAALSVIAMACALGLSVDGEGYSVTSEVVVTPDQEVQQILVKAEVDEALGPVFQHSLQHSLASAFESNGLGATIMSGLGPGMANRPGGDVGIADDPVIMNIDVKPLYRKHRDGYEALVGTVFEATLVDVASGEEAWRLSGTVDYIADQFFKQHGFRAHEGIIKEFAWHTTAAIVRTFMVDVAGRESAPIYTVTEARERHGQRID